MGGTTAVSGIHEQGSMQGEARDAHGLGVLCGLGQEHETLIDVPRRVKKGQRFTLTIEVKLAGQPQDGLEHFIEWIELYFGTTFLFRINLSGSLNQPKITIPVSLHHPHGPLKVWHKCNRHGIRERTREIVVED